MNSELAAKMAKRRAQVDEGGLHFESTPTELGTDAVPTIAQRQATTDKPVMPSIARCVDGGADLKASLSRRRAQTDIEDATWQSKPEASSAHCVSELQVGPRSTPAATSPDPGISNVVDEDTAAALPTPSRANCIGVGHDEQQEEEKQQSDEEHEGEEDVEEDVTEETAAPVKLTEEEAMVAESREIATEEAAVESKISYDGMRVNWQITFGDGKLPDVTESPSFQIKVGGKQAALSLRHLGAAGCELSLHCPDGKPAGVKALLFVSKGWKNRKGMKDLPDDQDLKMRFNVLLNGRRTVLCGMVCGR